MVHVGKLSQKVRVWRKENEKYIKHCLVSKLKGQRIGIMVWACFTGGKISCLTILEHGGQGAQEYLRTLENGLIPFLNELFPMDDGDSILVVDPHNLQDNAPCHTAPCIIQYLQQKHISILKWPANTPDLTPIEHLWGPFKRAFYK